MKKIIAIVLLCGLVLSVCACGESDADTNANSVENGGQNTTSSTVSDASADLTTSEQETVSSDEAESVTSNEAVTSIPDDVTSSEGSVSSENDTPSIAQTSSETQTSSKTETTSKPDVTNAVHTALSESQYYQYSQMTVNEKTAYTRLKTAAVNFENSVNVADLNLTVDEAIALIRCFAADHPQYFWISDHVSTMYNPDTNKATACVMLYSDGTVTDDMKGKTADRNKIKNRKAEVENKVKDIIKKIGSDWSDYDKEKYIHDYLVDTIKYNQNVAQNPITDGNVHQALDAYGALIGKSAVCEGYAKAFQYLCYEVGINANQVHGPDHEWNVVKLDGEWYQIDVTWDDPIVNGGSVNMKTYDFFNLTTKQMLAKEHSIDPNSPLKVPNCTATKNKYKK